MGFFDIFKSRKDVTTDVVEAVKEAASDTVETVTDKAKELASDTTEVEKKKDNCCGGNCGS